MKPLLSEREIWAVADLFVAVLGSALWLVTRRWGPIPGYLRWRVRAVMIISWTPLLLVLWVPWWYPFPAGAAVLAIALSAPLLHPIARRAPTPPLPRESPPGRAASPSQGTPELPEPPGGNAGPPMDPPR